ncbi:MAG: hypothetical protein P8X74_14650 [Reinekea sp.]
MACALRRYGVTDSGNRQLGTANQITSCCKSSGLVNALGLAVT